LSLDSLQTGSGPHSTYCTLTRRRARQVNRSVCLVRKLRMQPAVPLLLHTCWWRGHVYPHPLSEHCLRADGEVKCLRFLWTQEWLPGLVCLLWTQALCQVQSAFAVDTGMAARSCLCLLWTQAWLPGPICVCSGHRNVCGPFCLCCGHRHGCQFQSVCCGHRNCY
jgi:hypothetical protein